jgi:hypothetical protein
MVVLLPFLCGCHDCSAVSGLGFGTSVCLLCDPLVSVAYVRYRLLNRSALFTILLKGFAFSPVFCSLRVFLGKVLAGRVWVFLVCLPVSLVV